MVFRNPRRIGLAWLAAAGLAACASPPQTERAAVAAGPNAAPAVSAGPYSFFKTPGPRDPWSIRIGRWQLRQKAARRAGLIESFPKPPATPMPELPAVSSSGARSARAGTGGERLATRYDAFLTARRRAIAEEVLRWVQAESEQSFVDDGPVDHWPTLAEVLAHDGDDCDGLELLTFHALRQMGFPEDRVYRAVLHRPRFDQHHMVTLWFEDGNDPWVLDPTATITNRLRRLSELQGWIPLKVFSESAEYTVVGR